MAVPKGRGEAQLTPKVSVCLPAYQQPEYFNRTLGSVLEQSFVDFEIIVTDDSPDDDIASIVHETSDSRIVYVKNDVRLGSPANWNAAIRLARGAYVKFLHHDDWFALRDALAEFVGLLDDNPDAVLAFSASNACNADQALLFVHRPAEDLLAEIRRTPKTLLLGNWIGAPSATMYRRSVGLLFDTALQWVVDIDFYVRILSGGKGFAYSPRPLVNVTATAPHQITQESEGNPQVELFEWFYLFGKHRRFVPRYRELKFLANLLGKYGIRSGVDVPARVVAQRRLLSLVLGLRKVHMIR